MLSKLSLVVFAALSVVTQAHGNAHASLHHYTGQPIGPWEPRHNGTGGLFPTGTAGRNRTRTPCPTAAPTGGEITETTTKTMTYTVGPEGARSTITTTLTETVTKTRSRADTNQPTGSSNNNSPDQGSNGGSGNDNSPGQAGKVTSTLFLTSTSTRYVTAASQASDLGAAGAANTCPAQVTVTVAGPAVTVTVTAGASNPSGGSGDTGNSPAGNSPPANSNGSPNGPAQPTPPYPISPASGSSTKCVSTGFITKSRSTKCASTGYITVSGGSALPTGGSLRPLPSPMKYRL